ncbi:hypothetical protein C8Q75DRAFT_492829 [Abortiporus biennis]|nr:hypothetical protein C8Q75DRAFT_492829 [Abortiporus biennis]
MINNASRIQELFLGIGLPSSTISLFVSPFTRLQKFLCFGSMSHSALANHNSWFNVISGRMPVLSHLGLSRFTSWPSQNQLSRLRFLRTLHFSGTQKHNFEITLVDILTTLTALSHLVELRFATPAFTIRSLDVTPDDDVHYVELPYLNSLEFIECLRSTSHVLLSHFMLHHGVKILILNPQSPTLGQPAHISSISELVPSSFLLSLRTNQVDIRESNHILPFTSGRTTENSTLWYPEAKSTTSSGMEILLVSTISHMEIGIRITGLSFRDQLLSNIDSVVSPEDIRKLHLDLNSGWFICLPAAFPSENSYILSTREDQDYNPLSWLKNLSNLEELSISPTEFGRNAHDVMSNSFGRKICCEFSPLLVENVAFSELVKEPQRKQARSPHLHRFSILCQGIYGTARWLKDFEEIFKAREKAGARELELVTVVYPVVMGIGVENELLEGMEMTRMEMKKVGRNGLDSVVDW